MIQIRYSFSVSIIEFEVAETAFPTLPITFAKAVPLAPESMVVFMPAFVTPPTIRNDSQPLFSRFTWANSLPTAKVIALTDPALQQHEELRGAWYMHPEHDIIEMLASFILNQAEAENISANNIVVYGSSLGGFGAIAVASCIPGSRAIAEIPQIDFENWLPAQVRPVEDLITGPVANHRKVRPEQVSLQERIRKSNFIPNYTIVTNLNEFRLPEQLDFHRWVLDSEIAKGYKQELVITSLASGHRVLPKQEALRFMLN
ncbi:hypothetical protein ACTXN6_13165 [Corynebacterium casei]|uniref:hypothetical protein n=1 Tax=Corynebacterium casei TaxID=160386 RepID=UPI003FD43279